MRHFKVGVLILVILTAMSLPAFATEEMANMSAKTLADFQKENSGTKGVVAWDKYHEYLAFGNAPRATLGASNMRFDTNIPEVARGSKDIIGFTTSGNETRKSLAELHPAKPGNLPISNGTKDVVAFTR